jgi:DNA-3-methyladenine glycosylase II
MQDAIDFLLAKDTVFKTIIEKYGLPIIPFRPQGFETLVLLILEQQVSIDSAKATFKITGRIHVFEPRIVFDLSDAEFRTIGVSRQRQATSKLWPQP